MELKGKAVLFALNTLTLKNILQKLVISFYFVANIQTCEVMPYESKLR